MSHMEVRFSGSTESASQRLSVAQCVRGESDSTHPIQIIASFLIVSDRLREIMAGKM